MMEPRDLPSRLQALENVLAAASAGFFQEKVTLREDVEIDELSAVEHGVNTMLDDIAALREQDTSRTRQLEEMLDVTQAQAKKLEEALDTIRNQQQSIAELSTPILQLWTDVLAMPIIGVVDTKRSLDIMERLLAEVSERQTRFVILDITGVEVVDTRTADHFIKMAQATKLLGAECIVSGVRPAVAQTLVEIGVNLSSLQLVSTIRDALRVCLKGLKASASAETDKS